MKFRFTHWLIFILALGTTFARTPTTGQITVEAPEAWMGVQLAKPDPSMFAHLPDLPAGMGFLVTSVTPGGPAEVSGLSAFDVIWKLDGQMLVNEAQLAALLRLHKPGERVGISAFRRGKPADFTIILGKATRDHDQLMASMIDGSLLPDGVVSVPTRIVRVNTKVASYSTEDGQIDVSKMQDGYSVRITALDGKTIYDGTMDTSGRIRGLSPEWLRRAQALRRGLDHQLAADSSANMATRSAELVPQARPQPSGE